MGTLVQHGAAIESAAGIGSKRPLHSAATMADTSWLAELIRLRADVNALDDAGQTPLFEAATGSAVHLLLQSRADVSILASADRTPLHTVVQMGGDDIEHAVMELIKAR